MPLRWCKTDTTLDSIVEECNPVADYHVVAAGAEKIDDQVLELCFHHEASKFAYQGNNPLVPKE